MLLCVYWRGCDMEQSGTCGLIANAGQMGKKLGASQEGALTYSRNQHSTGKVYRLLNKVVLVECNFGKGSFPIIE